jgi:hypothetical protein
MPGLVIPAVGTHRQITIDPLSLCPLRSKPPATACSNSGSPPRIDPISSFLPSACSAANGRKRDSASLERKSVPTRGEAAGRCGGHHRRSSSASSPDPGRGYPRDVERPAGLQNSSLGPLPRVSWCHFFPAALGWSGFVGIFAPLLSLIQCRAPPKISVHYSKPYPSVRQWSSQLSSSFLKFAGSSVVRCSNTACDNRGSLPI